MPCYNYCPIAKSTDRAKPKHEDSSPGDCECGSSGDKSCGSGNVNGQSCGGGGSDPSKSTTNLSRPKLLHKEARSMCPMTGDIENWPPVYEDEDVQVIELVDNFEYFITLKETAFVAVLIKC